MICVNLFVRVVDAWLREVRDVKCDRTRLVITPIVCNGSRSIKVIKHCQIDASRGRQNHRAVAGDP
jgi:hypothetical protein